MTGRADGLVVTRQAGVATITLNHPERANALAPAEMHTLADTLSALDAESDLRALILTGAGDRAFCAGLDLNDPDAIREDLVTAGPTGLGAVLRAANALSIPLIGRINGACVAGGLGLLGGCSLVVASSNAVFGLPEIRNGLYPFIALAALHNRAPESLLARLADTGQPVDAATALDAGLVDIVCESAEIDAVVARELAAFDQTAAAQISAAMPDLLLEARLAAAEARSRDLVLQIVDS